MTIENSLWVEKYRPKKIEEMVLPEEYLTTFKKYFSDKDIPHLLFNGPPGSGKTTLARIIVSKNGILQNKDFNLLEISGSSKESRGIGFVDNVIEPFLKTPPVGDKLKVVFIDEGDNLTQDSFKSLRYVIEKYSEHSRFIFTCNYISKIPDPIQSRLQLYTFQQYPMTFVLNYCKDILRKENIKEYDEKDLQFVIESLYPDVRKIITTLQRFCLTGKLIVNRDITLSNEKIVLSSVVEIIGFISSREYSKIGKVLTTIINVINSNQDLDYRRVYETLFFMKEIPVPAKIIINKYSNKHQECLLPNMHFMGMVFEIIRSLKEYFEEKSK